MSRLPSHAERHRVSRIGWLRAAVLGANDGLVSTASLIIGVAAAEATRGGVLIAGAAGLVAGAMSMAAGEYVSVSSQSDTEKADIARERPVQAALTSALTFALGSLPPLLLVTVAPLSSLILWVGATALAALMGLGALGALAGGADIGRSVMRVAFWGALAMAATAGIGRVFGTVV